MPAVGVVLGTRHMTFSAATRRRVSVLRSHFNVAMGFRLRARALPARRLVPILCLGDVPFRLPLHVSPAYWAPGCGHVPVALSDPAVEAVPMDDVATLWPSGQGVCGVLIVALPTDDACLSIRDGGVSSGSPVAEPCLSCTPQLDVEVRFSQHAHDTCAAFVFFFSIIATCRDVLLVEPRVHFPGASDALRGEPCVEAIKGPKFDPHFLEYWNES